MCLPSFGNCQEMSYMVFRIHVQYFRSFGKFAGTVFALKFHDFCRHWEDWEFLYCGEWNHFDRCFVEWTVSFVGEYQQTEIIVSQINPCLQYLFRNFELCADYFIYCMHFLSYLFLQFKEPEPQTKLKHIQWITYYMWDIGSDTNCHTI